jgi:uncharacterized protein YkwD
MKAIIYIAFFLISASAFAQTALDSIILKKANEYRDSLCLPRLEFSKACFAAAESQATFQMKDLSKLTHDQNGSDIGDRYKKASGSSRTGYVGEIIAACNKNFRDSDSLTNEKIAEALIAQWKSSKGHNAILTNSRVKYAGASALIVVSKMGIKGWTHYDIRGVMVLSDTK